MTDHQPATVVVPREPTEAMIQVGYRAYGRTQYAQAGSGRMLGWGESAASIYTAMLSAAPAQSPAALDEAVGLLRRWESSFRATAPALCEQTRAFLANLEPSQ